MTIRRLSRSALSFFLAAVFVAACCTTARALPADELDREFLFASGLIDLGFSDFAEKVVQGILRVHPDQKDRAKLIQAQILISRNKFADAEELVKTMEPGNPKAQAITLALAKAYYVMGDTDKAKQLYNSFFQQYEGRIPTDPDLLRFYQDSAYQFGQMLELAGDKEGAIKAYGRVLGTNPDKNTARHIMAQQAQLWVDLADGAPLGRQDQCLAEAKKLCEQIQWGGLDIWFGQSVITQAHMELIRGDRAGALKVLQNNMDIFKEIDGYLKEQGLPLSVSPMAGARSLLGKLFRQQADALAKQGKDDDAVQNYAKALTEYYNVFAQYGDSDWGPAAGIEAQEIKTILEEKYRKTVKVDLGDYAAKAAEAQFRLADNAFRQKQYENAVAEYVKNLNRFPESDVAPAALGNLALSYANLNDKLMAKMVTLYTSERFAGKDAAALVPLAVGKYYFDQKDEPMYMFAYEAFLQHFPKNGRAAAILFTMAGLKKQAGDKAAATKYLERIVDNYPQDRYYTKALSQMAWDYFLASNYAGAVKGLAAFLAEAQPSPEKAQAQFALADAYRQLGQLSDALAQYETVIQWLAPKANPYATSATDAKKNAELLEKAVFQRGYCMSRIKEPPEAVPDLRQKGIRAYEQFLSLFPESKLAPAAYSSKGAIQLEIGQFDAAAKTFDELAAKYPQSDEGKSALFSLARSALEVKQFDQARSAFGKMLSNPELYTGDQFARVGQMMLDAGLYTEAAQAFEEVAKVSQERNLLERALFGVGSANFQQKKYEEAIRSLSDLMTRYPKSGLFYDAKFMLGTAYLETGNATNAMLEMSDVLKYADTPLLVNKASYELGKIQIGQGDKQGALASFLRVALLADPSKAELRPLVEKCLWESINLAMELGRYDDALDSCDQYLKVFPESDKVETVRKLRGDAKLKSTEAAAAASPAGK